MNPAAKHLLQTLVTLLTLAKQRDENRLDLDGQAVLDVARLELERHPARELVAGLLEWQRSGMPRRDPRPRSIVDTGLKAQTPAEEARAATRRDARTRHAF